MSAIEIRGKFVKLLADVEDAAMLEQMLAYCLALVKGEHPLLSDKTRPNCGVAYLGFAPAPG